MKNLTILFAVLSISCTTMAADWPKKRLDRLYNSDKTHCLKISKRYIKYLPDNPVPYYYASIVYRDKSKTHGEMKTRYMMMMKSIGYAMKFDAFDDFDLETKLNFEGYLNELAVDTDSLIQEMAVTDLACYGERLAIKHEKMILGREDIILVAAGSEVPPVTFPASGDPGVGGAMTGDSSNVASSEPMPVEEQKGFYGLASGKEVAPSYNKIQEEQLLEMINEERAALFMHPLKLETSLTRAARYHANDMALQNYFMADSYDRVGGQLKMVADAKTRNAQFHQRKHLRGINIAAGPQNAMEALNDWMEYDEQYDVLFDESSKKVGIGIFYDPSSEYGYYWVLVTAKR